MNNYQAISDVTSNPSYLYFVNYRIGQKELCILEMKSIFNIDLASNVIISSLLIDPSRSVFINGRMDIISYGDTLENLENNIINMSLVFNQYKISFINLGDYVEYNERLIGLRLIGFAIEGEFAIKNPLISLALTKVDEKWIFGYYSKNNNEWRTRIKKPFNYSYALDVKLAKTIVNIAIKNNFDLKIIDPCCGIGTILIEGKVMGVDIKGYDLNEIVVNKCNGNLKYFKLKDDAVYKDMLTLETTYDIAILDLPYGKFSLTSLKEQQSLILKTKDLVKKAVIVSMDDISNMISECGFNIIDTCIVTKSNAFKRHIYVCK